jgi:hypothetical protein
MKELMHENLECTLGDKNFGAIFSADDIILSGASARKFQCMINICSANTSSHGITLNPAEIIFIVVCMADATVLVSR